MSYIYSSRSIAVTTNARVKADDASKGPDIGLVVVAPGGGTWLTTAAPGAGTAGGGTAFTFVGTALFSAEPA